MDGEAVELHVIKQRIAEAALKRYRDHKARTGNELTARNMAVAQTAQEFQFRYSSDSIRRELSRLLDPAPGPRWADPPRTNPQPPRPPSHWRLPS